MKVTTATTLQNSFCKNIKELREERKWSQGYLAHRMGISISLVSKIESGYIQATLSCIEQIAMIYELPITELLKTDDELFKKAEDISHLTALKKKLAIREGEVAALHQKLIKLYEEFQYRNVSA
jgi:transcriptional regulator with XRE-family HTH domain